MVWSSDVDHKHILVVNKPAHNLRLLYHIHMAVTDTIVFYWRKLQF